MGKLNVYCQLNATVVLSGKDLDVLLKFLNVEDISELDDLSTSKIERALTILNERNGIDITRNLNREDIESIDVDDYGVEIQSLQNSHLLLMTYNS